MPGMKWSTPLFVGSIGIRVTADQVFPSVEVLIDDVVRRAARSEAAVLPGDVDPAVAGDLGRRQRRRAEIAGDAVLADARDGDRRLPGGAAVGRAERADARAALVWDDDGPVRLDDRLAAEAGGRPAGSSAAPR